MEDADVLKRAEDDRFQRSSRRYVVAALGGRCGPSGLRGNLRLYWCTRAHRCLRCGLEQREVPSEPLDFDGVIEAVVAVADAITSLPQGARYRLVRVRHRL